MTKKYKLPVYAATIEEKAIKPKGLKKLNKVEQIIDASKPGNKNTEIKLNR